MQAIAFESVDQGNVIRLPKRLSCTPVNRYGLS